MNTNKSAPYKNRILSKLKFFEKKIKTIGLGSGPFKVLACLNIFISDGLPWVIIRIIRIRIIRIFRQTRIGTIICRRFDETLCQCDKSGNCLMTSFC